jgi:hypothetical protein
MLNRDLRWSEFDPRSGQIGLVVDKVTAGRVFSEYFPLPILILSTDPRSLSSYHPTLYNLDTDGVAE